MTLPVFPTLPGLGWSVKKTPTFSTRVATHSSGREVRVPLFTHALYQFELVFDGLDSAGKFPGLQANSLQTLMGFYVNAQGQGGTFLYNDPDDNAATACAFGTGDGGSTQWVLQKLTGSVYEPASYVTNVAGVTVNGAASTTWTLLAPNVIQFAGAPANTSALAWTGTFGYQCRFLDDTSEFEKFMAGLWRNASLKFRQVR